MPFFDESNFMPEQSPGFLVRVTSQLCLANLDTVFADEGLTSTQWITMISLHFGFADTCAALAREISHDKGAMTRLIDVLEARGWVERERDADDRRVVKLRLTEPGLEVAIRARRRVIACWNAWLDDWSEEEITQFIAQLQRLRARLEREAA